MFSKVIQDEMNEQIKHELYSAYLYLAMAAYLDHSSLPGFAHWMRLQAQEEVEHAMKFFDYIHDRGGRVVLQAIDQPPAEFKSPTAIFSQAYEHEQMVTGRINHIYGLAVQEKDFASQEFLNWFVKEQVEEEKSASQILETLKMSGEQGHSLVMLDRQLGEREAEEDD